MADDSFAVLPYVDFERKQARSYAMVLKKYLETVELARVGCMLERTLAEGLKKVCSMSALEEVVRRNYPAHEWVLAGARMC